MALSFEYGRQKGQKEQKLIQDEQDFTLFTLLHPYACFARIRDSFSRLASNRPASLASSLHDQFPRLESQLHRQHSSIH